MVESTARSIECSSNSALCILHPGASQGDGPASAEAVRHPPRSAAVHQILEPEPVALAHLETDEATHAGASLFFYNISTMCNLLLFQHSIYSCNIVFLFSFLALIFFKIFLFY